MVYETLSKHLNIVQLYWKGKAFIAEQKQGPLNDVIERLMILNGTRTAKETNQHMEDSIADVYECALKYLDSERDRDVVKFLLAKITSVSFAAKLQGVKNKSSIRKCLGKVPVLLDEFHTISENTMDEVQRYSSLNERQKKALFRRIRDAVKTKQLKHRYQNQTGRNLKVEEFHDLAAILEYEFSEGGGLESHSKLRRETLYRAADNKTKMKDARAALLALTPDDFTITLSSCYNYTQSFKEGTFQARRHHKGRGVNACILLHKAPDTAPVKDLVINIHWTSANVNYILDEAAESPENYCVDSKDAKKANKSRLKIWRENVTSHAKTFRTVAV